MQIGVGSGNYIKVQAVRQVIRTYRALSRAQVISIEVPSGVSEQPRSLIETMRGARNRAIAAREGYDLGIGIESGLVRVPLTKAGYMDLCACAVYDGETFAFGLSSAFECPPEVTRLAVREGLDLNEAFLKTGLTTDPHIGAGSGAIGILTNGRVNRLEYTKQALYMALVQIEFPKLYTTPHS